MRRWQRGTRLKPVNTQIAQGSVARETRVLSEDGKTDFDAATSLTDGRSERQMRGQESKNEEQE